MYIACPRCDWRPEAQDRWLCTCGHAWNTFQTQGVCPACGKAWKLTKCSTQRGCGEWSDHEEWYHDDEGLSVEEFIANPQRASDPVPVQ